MKVFISIILATAWVCISTSQLFAANSREFASPEEGVTQLIEALDTRNQKALKAIFGEQSDRLISSGDSVHDAAAHRTFVKLYKERNKLEYNGSNQVTLLLGQDEWPFPVPLKKEDSGWIFDTAGGIEEIINRRIGVNELRAIQLCKTYVNAQETYFSRDRDDDGFKEYAQLFVSSPGRKNGLFWPRKRGDGLSPLGLVALEAWAEGYQHGKSSTPAPYHGYLFRILTKQGPDASGGAKNYITQGGRMTDGFAMIAQPAKWGASGVMTFLVNQDGVVYQKNIGPETSRSAAAIKEFNPDSSWEKVEEVS